MAVKIKRCDDPIDEPLDLFEFADRHGFNITISERPHVRPGRPDRFYAKIDGAEIKDGGCLIGAFGNGSTPGDACREYARRINGKKLVIDAYGPERREIWAHLDLDV